MGCHATSEGAGKQIAAIEANEGKEMSETVTSNTIALDPATLEAKVEPTDGDKKKEYVPFGVISFAELEKQKRSERIAWEAQDLADTFAGLVYNITTSPEIDREMAMNNLVTEFQIKMEDINKVQHGMIKEVDDAEIASEENLPSSPEVQKKSDFMVWKDVNDEWRWMTVYSNKFRDSDRIPEIISEKSHRAFESLVDEGIVPPPDLWLWHVPGTMWGKSDMVTYTDGFSIAFGTILPGYEYIAENLSKAIDDGEDIAVSHGMPGQFIIRNKEDPTVIDFHITREISVLPRSAAANKLTGFVVFKQGETEMPIPDEKKEWLLGIGLEADQIEKLESGLAKQAAAADEAGIESKESEEAEPVAKTETKEEVADVKEEAPEETPDAKVEEEDEKETKDIETPAEPTPLTRDEIAEAMTAVVALVTESNEAVNSRLGDIEAQMKELQVSDENKVKDRIQEIPTDSVLDLMKMSVIGQEDAVVDGRKKLAKDGPEETVPTKASHTGSPFIDNLMDAAITPVTE